MSGVELADFKARDESSRREVSTLKEAVQELEDKMAETCSAHNTTLTEMRESNEEEVKFLKADQEIAVRDLTMQLEISNAQKAEFEDRSDELAQEIKDLNEERKIGEKKHQGLVKDLKRQLMSEKQRNEKLSEKLDKILAETAVTVLGENFQAMQI